MSSQHKKISTSHFNIFLHILIIYNIAWLMCLWVDIHVGKMHVVILIVDRVGGVNVGKNHHLLEVNRTRHEITQARTYIQRHMNNALSEMVSSTLYFAFAESLNNNDVICWSFICLFNCNSISSHLLIAIHKLSTAIKKR